MEVDVTLGITSLEVRRRPLPTYLLTYLPTPSRERKGETSGEGARRGRWERSSRMTSLSQKGFTSVAGELHWPLTTTHNSSFGSCARYAPRRSGEGESRKQGRGELDLVEIEYYAEWSHTPNEEVESNMIPKNWTERRTHRHKMHNGSRQNESRANKAQNESQTKINDKSITVHNTSKQSSEWIYALFGAHLGSTQKSRRNSAANIGKSKTKYGQNFEETQAKCRADPESTHNTFMTQELGQAVGGSENISCKSWPVSSISRASRDARTYRCMHIFTFSRVRAH
eukprot:4353400-Pleurochrysis_carterae.AAC.2